MVVVGRESCEIDATRHLFSSAVQSRSAQGYECGKRPSHQVQRLLMDRWITRRPEGKLSEKDWLSGVQIEQEGSGCIVIQSDAHDQVSVIKTVVLCEEEPGTRVYRNR